MCPLQKSIFINQNFLIHKFTHNYKFLKYFMIFHLFLFRLDIFHFINNYIVKLDN